MSIYSNVIVLAAYGWTGYKGPLLTVLYHTLGAEHGRGGLLPVFPRVEEGIFHSTVRTWCRTQMPVSLNPWCWEALATHDCSLTTLKPWTSSHVDTYLSCSISTKAEWSLCNGSYRFGGLLLHHGASQPYKRSLLSRVVGVITYH